MSKAEKKISPTATHITMNLHAIDENTNETHWKWIKNDGEQQKSASIWTHLDLSPLSSSFSLHVSPLFFLPVYVPLQVQSFPLFLLFSGPLVFLPLSVPLCRLVWCRCSWTPPLTDDSRDATLLCTAQCTAILPQWALDLWWMERITPSTLEW